jgi:hypothetical protein
MFRAEGSRHEVRRQNKPVPGRGRYASDIIERQKEVQREGELKVSVHMQGRESGYHRGCHCIENGYGQLSKDPERVRWQGQKHRWYILK